MSAITSALTILTTPSQEGESLLSRWEAAGLPYPRSCYSSGIQPFGCNVGANRCGDAGNPSYNGWGFLMSLRPTAEAVESFFAAIEAADREDDAVLADQWEAEKAFHEKVAKWGPCPEGPVEEPTKPSSALRGRGWTVYCAALAQWKAEHAAWRRRQEWLAK